MNCLPLQFENEYDKSHNTRNQNIESVQIFIDMHLNVAVKRKI